MTDQQPATNERTFGDDVEFLRTHVETIVLQDSEGGPAVAVVPAYQGRVMTSTAGGSRGISYGWMNYEQIASGETVPQINVYGGEERFWLGPEGGQYSIFFKPGSTFDFAEWQTPAVIDTDRFAVAQVSETSVAFRHEAEVTNYSDTTFSFRVERDVELLAVEAIRAELDLAGGDFRAAAYRTTNRLTNIGSQDWTKESGLLSIWMLGMYKHGPNTTIVIPFNAGEESTHGEIVNDDYFGQVPAERLRVADGVIYFSGDGQFRSKIGLSPARSTPVCGSYDAARQVLTVVKYNQPDASVRDYVNSKWALQDEPYAGDVINAYNDGPAAPGAKPLGPFYELETSSPALALAAGESGQHVQSTFHFESDAAELDAIARKVFGVSPKAIEAGLK